ncbi:MAG: UDP-glucose 4-epimerase GalE [Pirellulaceae bacterium]|nr:MAG: UDP-glucose 4-epimerase GalE [Pirellulaceae bacterium]
MRILVTGGAGYVGSHAVRALLRQGHEVWVYDNLSRGHRRAVPEELLIFGDISDTRHLAAVMRDRQIEAVMHFAAYALVGESVADPALYYVNNLAAGISLLEAMRQSDVSKIVFSSTTATYGIPETVPIPEQAPQRPINPYGFTKYCFERMLDDYARAYGWAAAALRYFNAAGAAADGSLGEDHDPETHLIPLALQVALGRRDELVIFGDDYPTQDGTCVRDYVHVEDLAEAHLAALERLQPRQVWKLNLGIGVGYSVRQVIEACRHVTGHPIPTRIGPRRPGDPPVLVADSRLAREMLGWTPRYQKIEDIVATAWAFHRRFPRGYEDR